MLGLPQSTEVRRPLPKAGLYRQFNWKPSQREGFDREVARLDFVNWIAPRTLSAMVEGTEVKEIYVVEVSLKRRDFDLKNIVLLGKSIPQRMVYALRYEDEIMLAVYHSKLFVLPWQASEAATLPLKGLNLDAVWQNIVTAIGQFTVEQGCTLDEQIQVNEERAKRERQIAALEHQMNTTKQPHRKRELFVELQKMKNIR